jgi:hypothetical protein
MTSAWPFELENDYAGRESKAGILNSEKPTLSNISDISLPESDKNYVLES